MKVLVSVASRYGATGEIARSIGEALAERGLETAVIPPDQVQSLEGYDAVVLGSAVYAGRWLKPAREMVGRLGDSLAARPVWLFSSGPIGDPPKPEGDPTDIEELAQRTRARAHRVFGGRMERRALTFPDRAIVTAMRVPDGDYRDWVEIEGWASGIAEELGAGSLSAPGQG